MNYKQLTQEERYQIYALLKAKHTQKQIAEILGRSRATISRELRRNKETPYELFTEQSKKLVAA